LNALIRYCRTQGVVLISEEDNVMYISKLQINNYRNFSDIVINFNDELM